DHFERALQASREGSDIFQLVRNWEVYGSWAAVLGNIELAKSNYERALFVALQYQLNWLIPDANLCYVGVLMWTGRYGLAYEHLLEALSYDVDVSSVDAKIAEFGIPLALRMNDKAILANCVRPSALDFAFRCG